MKKLLAASLVAVAIFAAPAAEARDHGRDNNGYHKGYDNGRGHNHGRVVNRHNDRVVYVNNYYQPPRHYYPPRYYSYQRPYYPRHDGVFIGFNF